MLSGCGWGWGVDYYEDLESTNWFEGVQYRNPERGHIAGNDLIEWNRGNARYSWNILRIELKNA